jgi:integrase/recombinase XerD
MRGCEPRWEHFPTAAGCAWARRWLAMQANRMLAKNTIDSYSRSMEDFLGFAGRVGISPESATTEHVAEYVRDLCTRENPAQPKTVYIDSRAGLSNATVHLRLTVVRLFYDFLARREPLRNRLMLALSYDAALRRQELLGLETADIDPAHRLLHIRFAISALRIWREPDAEAKRRRGWGKRFRKAPRTAYGRSDSGGSYSPAA